VEKILVDLNASIRLSGTDGRCGLGKPGNCVRWKERTEHGTSATGNRFSNAVRFKGNQTIGEGGGCSEAPDWLATFRGNVTDGDLGLETELQVAIFQQIWIGKQ
jgi:hypothetical protein